MRPPKERYTRVCVFTKTAKKMKINGRKLKDRGDDLARCNFSRSVAERRKTPGVEMTPRFLPLSSLFPCLPSFIFGGLPRYYKVYTPPPP